MWWFIGKDLCVCVSENVPFVKFVECFKLPRLCFENI